MKSAIWNFVGVFGLVAVLTWAMSVQWKIIIQPLECVFVVVLGVIAAALAFYLGAEDEEN